MPTSKNKKENKHSQSLDKNTTISNNKRFSLPFPRIIDFDNQEMVENIVLNHSQFKCDAFQCRSISSFISCFEVSENCIFLGLKSDSNPFNIFEKRSGKSKIMILNKNLEIIKTVEFEYGDVMQFKYIHNNLYVLFSNGFLIRITDLQNTKYSILYNAYKIISFDIDGTNVVFTDGARIFCNETSKTYNGVLIKTILYQNHIITMDVNGKVMGTTLDFSKPIEIAFKYSIFNIKVVENALVVFIHSLRNKTDTEIEKLILFPFAKSPSEISENESRFIHFFSATATGIIESYKRYKSRRKIKKVFQIYRKGKDVNDLVVKYDDFDDNRKCFVSDVIDCDEYFIFCTEDGLILKVSYY